MTIEDNRLKNIEKILSFSEEQEILLGFNNSDICIRIKDNDKEFLMTMRPLNNMPSMSNNSVIIDKKNSFFQYRCDASIYRLSKNKKIPMNNYLKFLPFLTEKLNVEIEKLDSLAYEQDDYVSRNFFLQINKPIDVILKTMNKNQNNILELFSKDDDITKLLSRMFSFMALEEIDSLLNLYFENIIDKEEFKELLELNVAY